MRSRRIALLVLLIVVTALPACTGGEEPSDLATVEDQHFGLRVPLPEGWVETAPGQYAPAGAAPGEIMLIAQAYPEATAAATLRQIARWMLGLSEIPRVRDRVNSGGFAWELYQADAELPDIGELHVDIGLADREGSAYVVVLVTTQAKHKALRDGVFLPALRGLETLPFDRRDHLMAEALLAADFRPEAPVNNAYLGPLGDYGPAHHALEGVLAVPEFRLERPIQNGETVSLGQRTFPGFSVAFFTDGDALVPAERDILVSSGRSSTWRIILSPGRVWSEAADGGLSRAAFPFVLVGTGSNNAHNGLATLVYDDQEVSSLYVQVVQETCSWNHSDYWGATTATYAPGPVGEAVKSEFAAELAAQLPIHRWSELGEQVDPELLVDFNSGTPPLDVSAAGVVVDDTIYLQLCNTRYGPYPFCSAMRHGVFSVTKSMGAAVALLRLAEKYGEAVFDLRIADFVEITAAHDGWAEVTFGDALNMATGIGDDPNLTAFTGEEDQPRFSEFMAAKSAQDKLGVAFSYGKYPWGPGEVARYNSINTFVLGVAMDAFLKSQEGPEADIWDMVVEEVYRPIGIYHAPIMRTVEPDGGRGLPIFGYGLYPTADDIAKVARLYHNGGRHEGEQLLHPGRLGTALHQIEGAGLPNGERNAAGEARYSYSFWSLPYRSAEGDFHQVPFMTGYGGNQVVVMPNGVTAFRLADVFIYDVEPMVRVGEALRPFPAP
jgi:hypothetical protein